MFTLNDWPAHRPTDWPTNWLNNWLTDRLNDWLNDRTTDRYDCLYIRQKHDFPSLPVTHVIFNSLQTIVILSSTNDRPIHRPTDWPTDWPNHRLNDWLNDRLNDWLNDRLKDWLNDLPNDRPIWLTVYQADTWFPVTSRYVPHVIFNSFRSNVIMSFPVCTTLEYTRPKKKLLAFSFANFEMTRGSTGMAQGYSTITPFAPPGHFKISKWKAEGYLFWTDVHLAMFGVPLGHAQLISRMVERPMLRSAVGMTHGLRSDLWWTIPLRILLDQFWDTSLVIRLYSDQIILKLYSTKSTLAVKLSVSAIIYPWWTATTDVPILGPMEWKSYISVLFSVFRQILSRLVDHDHVPLSPCKSGNLKMVKWYSWPRPEVMRYISVTPSVKMCFFFWFQVCKYVLWHFYPGPN